MKIADNVFPFRDRTAMFLVMLSKVLVPSVSLVAKQGSESVATKKEKKERVGKRRNQELQKEEKNEEWERDGATHRL